MLTRRDFLETAASVAASAALPGRALEKEGPPSFRLGVFELRHYRTEPGRREDLIAMFEEHFLDAYERAGALVLGTFRNLDAPDRWAWIRAFPSLEARETALTGFYTSGTWKARSEACNATLADVSEARLLAPLEGRALSDPPPRPPAGRNETPRCVYEVLIHQTPPEKGADFAAFHRSHARPALASLGQLPSAVLLTGPGMTADPKRPVSSGTYLVTLTRFADAEALHAARAARRDSSVWQRIESEMAQRLRAPVEAWRLQPTSRSALR